MSILYELNFKERLLVTRLAETVTYDEFYATYKAILAATPDWDKIHELSLISDGTHIEITPQELRDLAERLSNGLSERNLTMKTAFIAASDPHYGLASIYRAQAAFTGVMEITVLRNLDEGLQWLGIDSEQLDQILIDHPG